MDIPSNYRQPPSKRSHGGAGANRKRKPQNPQLFDDTSADPGYGQPPAAPYPGNDNMSRMAFAGQQLFTDPMANMAMAYGQSLADQGQELLHKNADRFFSVSKLKYYFAVDTVYVCKKLALLFLPFTHTNWAVQYNQSGSEPVAPRFDVNAPDLYIPTMSIVTYVLVGGYVLGTQGKFSPEQLGMQCSSAVACLMFEIIVLWLSLYICNIKANIKTLDMVAFCSYKFVGMIASLLAGLVVSSLGYYLVLLWTSICIAFFLVRTLRVLILPHEDSDHLVHGNKRRLYLLLLIAVTQPLLMFWLTRHLMFAV